MKTTCVDYTFMSVSFDYFTLPCYLLIFQLFVNIFPVLNKDISLQRRHLY